MSQPKSIWLDATLAISIAVLTALSLGLAQEESYKYVPPAIRYWSVLCIGAIAQGCHALSKFRDGTFQKHKEAVAEKAKSDELKDGQATTKEGESKP